MKTQLFALLIFILPVLPVLPAVASAKEGVNFNSNLSIVTEAMVIKPAFAKAMACKITDPTDLKVVFSQKRIWLLADEMPMKCLKTVVKNSGGQVVMEKCFTSKCTDWFLNIEALPKGDYTLHLGKDRVEKFKK